MSDHSSRSIVESCGDPGGSQVVAISRTLAGRAVTGELGLRPPQNARGLLA